ncbi:MAG: methyltransferase domain-containing protein [Gemmatimonadaceae bacterium]|nr:methyltransferase domain-containing protein [Gemmatimonadaceae bacterium]
MSDSYVHGYDLHETLSLRDQADALVELLHADTAYPDGSTVLEVGCGVGAQTVKLARRSPGALITAVDRSPASLAEAERRVAAAGLRNVTFVEADLFSPPFGRASFDHLFLCFVLEHLSDPAAALTTLLRLLRPGGSVTVIEGDHGSGFFHPDDADARSAIASRVALQRDGGGDAQIGRRLYPLLSDTGLAGVSVTPRMVYVDGSRPDLADVFTRRTFTAMIAGVRERVLASTRMEPARFDAGIRALERAAAPDGVFCYTFFKAVG